MERYRQPRPIRWLGWLYTLTSRIRNVVGFSIRLFSIKKHESTVAARGFDGEFWLRNQPDVHEPGVLEVAPATAPIVKTVGALRSPWREEHRTKLPDGRTLVASNFSEEALTTPVTIHGLDDHGNLLTLLNAITSNLGRPDSAGRAHHYRGSHAIVGIHGGDRDHTFTGYRIRLSYLDAWQPLLAVKDWVSQVTLTSGESLALQELAPSDHGDRSHLWISIQGISPSSLRELDRRFLRPLMTIFSLSMDTPCPPLALQVQEESPDSPWLDVYSTALHAAQDTDLRFEQPRWLLQPIDIGVGHIAAWLDKVEQLGPLPAVVADMAHADSISVDTQALLLATVAEGMHRRLCPEEVRFDEKIAEQVQAVAAAAVDEIHPDAKRAVHGFLNQVGEVGFGKRLMRLAEAVEDAMPGVTGKTNKWKNLVYETRNEYAHRLSVGFLNDDDIDRRLTVVLSLRWLLTGLLLLQADIVPPVLAMRAQQHEQYLRFLANAALWQPRIYGTTP